MKDARELASRAVAFIDDLRDSRLAEQRRTGAQ